MVVLRRGISPGLAGFAVLLALLAVWSLSQDVVRGTLRERTFDLVLPLLPHPARGGPSVVIVDIDRDALARFGAWPWSRRRLAEVVSAAAAGKPAALGIDILLAGTDRFSEDGDAMMAQAVSGAPSVLGFVLETANTGQDLPATPILSSAPVSLPGVWRADGIIGPVALIADAAQGFGALVTAADADGPIRRVPLLVIAGGVVRPGLAVEVIRLAQGAGALLIDPGGILHIGDVGLPLGHDATLRLEASSAVRVIPALNLIDDKAARDALAGRIVLIGSSAPELGGLRVTPASPATPSVLIQAEAVEAMLRGDVPVRPSSGVVRRTCRRLRSRPAVPVARGPVASGAGRVACSFRLPGVGSRRGGSRARAPAAGGPDGPACRRHCRFRGQHCWCALCATNGVPGCCG